MSAGSAGTRRTFVVQVQREGRTLVEDVLTQERVAVASLAGAADQIETWLAQAGAQPRVDLATNEED